MSAGYLAKCATKRRHATQALAEDHRRAMVRMGRWTTAGSNTYFCNQCGSFHAGRMGASNRGKGRKTRTRQIHHTQ
jgi:hypothetical protein